MKKLNLSSGNPIILDLFNEIHHYRPVSFAYADMYSWVKINLAEKQLEKTIEALINYYKNSKTLDNFLSNVGSIWNTLIDYISEEHLQDFIEFGYLSINKEKLKSIYEEYRLIFEEGYLDVVSDWYDSELESIEKQAYRHLRKETRSRISGIGFGVTGGLKAAIGSGIGNFATGIAHGAFNSIANGVDNLSKSVKYDNLYKNDKTLKNLVNGWKKTFWSIYDRHIQYLNQIIIEEETEYIINYTELKTREVEALQKYANLLKADLPLDETFENIVDFIYMYPFEIKYWKDFLYLLPEKIAFTANIHNKIINFLKEVDKTLNNDFFIQLAPIPVSMLIKKYTNDDVICSGDDNEDIIDIIKNYYKNESNILVNAISMLLSDDEFGYFDIGSLYSLLLKMNLTINDFLINDDIKEIYNEKMIDISCQYLGLNYEKMILPAIKSGNIDVIVNDIHDNKILDIETTLLIIISLILNGIKDKSLNNINIDILENIENLKQRLNLNVNLFNYSVFISLLLELYPLSEKVKMFNTYLKNIIKENDDYIFGKNAYWDKIPNDIENKIRDNFAISENEKILIAFDDTVFKSGKKGLVLTTNELVINDGAYPESVSWSNIAKNSNLSVFDDCFFIKSNENADKKFIHDIHFSGLAANINFSLLSNIIGAACVIFSGEMINIEHYEPFQGAELDISKLVIKKSKKKISLNNTEQDAKQDVKQDVKQDAKQEDREKNKQIKNEKEQKEQYYYLREENRIYTALKFKERKGFFRKILPASWFLTFIFYGVVASIALFIGIIITPKDSIAFDIVIAVFLFIVPITLWVIGIKKRIKYLKEKKKWKECTNSGKRPLELVFKEFQEMENEYRKQEEKTDIEKIQK